MPQNHVEWRSTPAVLYVGLSASHSTHGSGEPFSTEVSASVTPALQTAQHFLVFSTRDRAVAAAPLQLKYTERHTEASVKPTAQPTPQTALSSSTAEFSREPVTSEATQNSAGGDPEEWVDAVDDEALAFFDEDDET